MGTSSCYDASPLTAHMRNVLQGRICEARFLLQLSQVDLHTCTSSYCRVNCSSQEWRSDPATPCSLSQ